MILKQKEDQLSMQKVVEISTQRYVNWPYQHCVKSVQLRSYFWSVFSCIPTEYGDLLCKSPYSVRIQENTDQRKPRIRTIFTQCRQKFSGSKLPVYVVYRLLLLGTTYYFFLLLFLSNTAADNQQWYNLQYGWH